MVFNWPTEELTVRGKIGIGTDTPSQELDVIGDISAANLNLNGSLTIDKNLAVGSNFQLGTLSINTFSSDGNLANNSNLAVPTEQAVKTYVDNQVSTKAALNGATNQDFATNNLSVGGNLQVSGNLEVQGDVIARDTEHIAGNVSLGDADNDEVKITGVIRSGHSSGALRIDDALHTTGSLSVDGSLSVKGAIATSQLSVTDRVTGSLTVENNLSVGSSLTTNEVNARGTIQANKFEGDGSGLTGINPGKWSDGSSGSIYYNNGNVGIGTTTPSHKFHVLASDAVGLFESSGSQAYLRLSTREGLNNRVEITNRSGGRLSLWTAGAGDVFNITRSGNVGIGTTTPEANLDVAGIIKAKGYKTKIYTDGGLRVGQGGLANDNTWRLFPNLSRTFTLTETATVIAFYKISMPGSNGHLVTRLLVDGGEVSRTIVGDTHYWGNSDFWVDELAAGTHSVQVQYRTPFGGINNPAGSDWQNRVLRIMVLGS